MSYFNACENCGIEFKETQYVFAWCEKCLTSMTCYKCNKKMTMEDHRQSTSELCAKCDKEYWAEIEKQKELSKNPYSDLSDSELEAKWQNSANMISQFALASWKDGISEEESKRLHKKAEEWQNIQSQIQAEISKRH